MEEEMKRVARETYGQIAAEGGDCCSSAAMSSWTGGIWWATIAVVLRSVATVGDPRLASGEPRG